MVYAKTAEPMEILFGGLTHVGPRKAVLDGGQDWTNPFAAVRGDKSAMRPFARLLWTLVKVLSLSSKFIIVIIKHQTRP